MTKRNIYIGIVITIILILAICIIYPAKINIAYMCDSKYLPYVMTSIDSAITNKSKNTHYNIYVIAKDFTNKDIENIKKIEQSDVKIHIIKAKEKNLNYASLGRFASYKISLQKLFIAEYLKDIDKVLYLDADTLIQGDLSKLYNTNIKEHYVAAVKDGLMYQFPEHIIEIGLNWRKFYFNSGVMLLNLKKIRKDNKITDAINYFNNNNEVFGDQDVLNVVFDKDVKSISYIYNCNSVYFEKESPQFLSDFYKEEVPQTSREVYNNAIILHFAGHKPWTQWFEHSYLKPLWWEYANKVKTKYKIDF